MIENKIRYMILEGYNYDQIAEKLKIKKKKIYTIKYKMNLESGSVKAIKKPEPKKLNIQKVIRDFIVTQEQIDYIVQNIDMKRSKLAKELKMDKVKLNMILYNLKD